LLDAKWANFQLPFNVMIMMFALYKTGTRPMSLVWFS